LKALAGNWRYIDTPAKLAINNTYIKHMNLSDFNTLGLFNTTQLKGYEPSNKEGLSYSECELISNTTPTVAKVIQKRLGTVNQNGWRVYSKLSASNNKNNALEARLYELLKTKANIDELIQSYVTMSSTYGQCYVFKNDLGRPVVLEPTFFELYFDNFNKEITHVNRTINRVTTTYYHGIELFRLCEPLSKDKAVPASPLDKCYANLLFLHHAMQANDNLISQGGVGSLIAIFEESMGNKLSQPTDLEDPKNPDKTMGAVILKKLKETMGLSKRKLNMKSDTPTHNIGFAVGVKELIELGKNNNDIMLPDLIKYCEDKIHDAFGLTLADSSSTYNNSANFNYQAYDELGKHFEACFQKMVNDWLLPTVYGIETSENLYFEFLKPNDPDEIAKNKLLLEVATATASQSSNAELKARVFNELRDSLSLNELDIALFETSTPAPTLPAIDPNAPVLPAPAETFATTKKKLQLR
jgi:hypothetical protein